MKDKSIPDEKSYLLAGKSQSSSSGTAGHMSIEVPPLNTSILRQTQPHYGQPATGSGVITDYPYPSPHSPSEGRTHKNLFTGASSSITGTNSTTMSMAGSTYQSLNTFELENGNHEDDTRKMSWEQYGRRTLYGSLPFMAAFGMQKKETTLKKVISAVSMNTLAKTLEGESAETISEKVQLEEVDVDEVSRLLFDPLENSQFSNVRHLCL